MRKTRFEKATCVFINQDISEGSRYALTRLSHTA